MRHIIRFLIVVVTLVHNWGLGAAQTAHAVEFQGGRYGGDMAAPVFRLYYSQEWPGKKMALRAGPSLFIYDNTNYWGINAGVSRVWRKKAFVIQLGALAGIDKNCWQYGPFLQVGAGAGLIDIKAELGAGFFWDDGPKTWYAGLIGFNYNFLAK